MKTEKFLDLLEEQKLIPPRAVEQIRAKLEQGNHRLSAKSLLKYLVKKKLIDRNVAKLLLQTTLAVNPQDESSILGLVPMPPIPKDPAESPPVDSESSLWILPDEDPPPEDPGRGQSSRFAASVGSEDPDTKTSDKGTSDKGTSGRGTSGRGISGRGISEKGASEGCDLPTEKLEIGDPGPDVSANVHGVQSMGEPPTDLEPIDLIPIEEKPSQQGPIELGPSQTLAAEPEEGQIDQALDQEVPEAAFPKKKKRRRGRKGRKENEWDSPLLLIGGGGLVALLVAGLFIGYLLSREDADQILEEANAFFDNGSYIQAIAQYERFVKGHTGHPQYSTAKVHLGMARLWKDTKGTSNFEQALQTAQRIVREIEEEPQFPEAQDDLASLLPIIAKGLVDQAEQEQAKQESDDQFIERRQEQSVAALSLCSNTKYIPKAFRNEQIIEEVKQTLDRVERGRQQAADLQQTLGQIDEAVRKHDPAAAYALGKQLMSRHPGLRDHPVLAAKVLEISQAERSVIQFVADRQAAETAERETKLVAALTLTARRGPKNAGQGSGHATGELGENGQATLAVNLDGAVYGLRADDGSVLWRRPVSLQSLAAPVAIGRGIEEGRKNGDGAYLVVDSTHHELVRLEGMTGKLKWRQSLGEPFARPVIANKRILAASASGKLHVVDLDTGERSGYVQFGQPISTAPVIGPGGERIYVVGSHSSLYTLDASDLSCLGVYYLGHAKGRVAVPPLVIQNKVAIAVNHGIETSGLHLLKTDKTGVIEGESANTRLEGLVTTRLLRGGRRLIALTSLGQVSVFEIGSEDGPSAMAPLAVRDAEAGSPVAHFGLVPTRRGQNQWHVWIAGSQLNKLAILPTGDRLPVREIDHNFADARFDHPLQMVGNRVVHVRRPAGQGGAIVGAMGSQSGTILWEIELAVPPAGRPIVSSDGSRITAASANGSIYQLDRQAMSRGIQDRAERLNAIPGNLPPLEASLAIAQDRVLYAPRAGGKNLLLYHHGALGSPLRLIPLESEIACPPIAWHGGAVVPTRVGQVLFFDSEANPSVTPFQPAIAPGTQYNWLPPALASVPGSKNKLLAISDGKEKLYLIDQKLQPQPHLTAVAECQIGPSPLETRLAVVDKTILAGREDGKLARFALPKLELADPIDLGARITWGPYPLGDRTLLVTASDKLVCLASDFSIQWQKPLPDDRPADRPLADGDGCLLLWQLGALTRIDLQTGKEVARLQLDLPVVAGPVPLGKRLLLTSPDGTLLVVNRP